MNLTLWELQVETWELIYVVKDISDLCTWGGFYAERSQQRGFAEKKDIDWAEFSPNHSKWSIISFLKNFWHANEKAMHYQILKRW